MSVLDKLVDFVVKIGPCTLFCVLIIKQLLHFLQPKYKEKHDNQPFLQQLEKFVFRDRNVK